MTRRAKYATLRRYQPYIDIIRKDLGIPNDALISVQFLAWRGKTDGTGYYSPLTNYGEVKVKKTCRHTRILSVLLHEFRHVWQNWTGKLSNNTYKYIKGKRGGYHYERYSDWDGVTYRNYARHNASEYGLYLATPWEVDAREYEKELDRLFPNGKLPEITPRKLIGKVNGVTFYKVKG